MRILLKINFIVLFLTISSAVAANVGAPQNSIILNSASGEVEKTSAPSVANNADKKVPSSIKNMPKSIQMKKADAAKSSDANSAKKSAYVTKKPEAKTASTKTTPKKSTNVAKAESVSSKKIAQAKSTSNKNSDLEKVVVVTAAAVSTAANRDVVTVTGNNFAGGSEGKKEIPQTEIAEEEVSVKLAGLDATTIAVTGNAKQEDSKEIIPIQSAKKEDIVEGKPEDKQLVPEVKEEVSESLKPKPEDKMLQKPLVEEKKRDPFSPFVDLDSLPNSSDVGKISYKSKTTLTLYPFAQYKLTGVIISPNKSLAIIKAPNGLDYFVQKADKIGGEGYEVSEIGEDSMKVKKDNDEMEILVSNKIEVISDKND
jgi:Tfp pilus assembly protein PilP